MEAPNCERWDEEPCGSGVREGYEAQGEEFGSEELGVGPSGQSVVLGGASAHMQTMEVTNFKLIAGRRGAARPGQGDAPLALFSPIESVTEQGEKRPSIRMMSGTVASRQVHDHEVGHTRVVLVRREKQADEGRRSDADAEGGPREGEEEGAM